MREKLSFLFDLEFSAAISGLPVCFSLLIEA
jgi:hypothetical protein